MGTKLLRSSLSAPQVHSSTYWPLLQVQPSSILEDHCQRGEVMQATTEALLSSVKIHLQSLLARHGLRCAALERRMLPVISLVGASASKRCSHQPCPVSINLLICLKKTVL
jgi:hypothetical protein